MHWSGRSDFGPEDDWLVSLRAKALGDRPALPSVSDSEQLVAIDLSSSNPTGVGLALPEVAALAGGGRAYQPHPLGELDARKCLVEAYQRRGFDSGPEQFCLLSSTSEGYLWLFELLGDPGETVLVPAPSYPLLDQLAQIAGISLRPYALRYAGGWELDPATLPSQEEIRREKIRAVVVVNPNNPTGSFLSRGAFEHLAQLGLPLIVDEVFRPFRLGRREPFDPLDLPGPLFLLDGLSKRAAAPGVKLGWVRVQGPLAFVRQAVERLSHFSDSLLSVSSSAQQALPALLGQEPAVQAVVLGRLRQNYEQLIELTRGHPLTVLITDAGYLAILRLADLVTEEEYLERLAERRVWAQPGRLYALPFSPALVVSLLPEPARFSTGIERLLSLLGELSQPAEPSGCPAG